jgi:hypothetical protein
MAYNDHKGHSQLPGVSDAVEQFPSRNYLHGEKGLEQYDGVRIEKDTDDEGHTDKTHVLLPGLVLVTGAALAGKYVDLDHASAPANDDITDTVILAEVVDLKNKSDVRKDCQAKVLVGGQVKNDQLEYNDADATRQGKAQLKAKLIRFV